jgi:hypothetical protein
MQHQTNRVMTNIDVPRDVSMSNALDERFNNSRRKQYTLANREVQADCEITRSGLWKAIIKLADGSICGGTYADEDAMRRDIHKHTKFKLEYVKNPSASQDPVDAAKRAMIDSGHGRKYDVKPTAVPTPTAAKFVFTPEQLNEIVDAIIKAYVVTHSVGFQVTPYNLSVISQCLHDVAEQNGSLVLSDEHLEQVLDWLFENNMISSVDPKNAGRPMTPYKTVNQVQQNAAANLGRAIQEETKRRSKLSLPELKAVLENENPKLKLGGGLDPRILQGANAQTETLSTPRRPDRTEEEKEAYAKPLDQLAAEERQRQQEARRRREGR